MVLTTRTFTMLFTSPTADSSNPKTLIRLPLSVVPQYEQRCQVTGVLVATANKPLFRTNLWTSDEHERFLYGLEMFPNGPWKEVAAIVGTKTTRQTMTHAQKYRQKIERRMVAKPKKLRGNALSRNTRDASAFGLAQCTSGGNHTVASYSAVDHTTDPRSAVSPTDVHSDPFDVSFLEYEFDAILKRLEPALSGDDNHASPSSLADHVGVFSE